MNVDGPTTFKDQKEKQNLLVKVGNTEKDLWALINSKGPLHKDIQNLYRIVCADYENIILSNDEGVEFQDVEYSLWKLHYKHIDEFRKRIRQSSPNADSTKSGTPQDVASKQNGIDNLMEGFKSFLSEATEFYQNLITKLRRCYGLPEEPLLYKKGGGSYSIESSKLHRYQYSCHRFFVCLGDLTRYQELRKKNDDQKCNWSFAASYYLEATMVLPDSGNPQNQLALLATYVGDDFLALYHCVRSLAVKEPFPDAWDNLKLLFEKNSSSSLRLLSTEVHFDFLEPSERTFSLMKSHSSIGSSTENEVDAAEYVSAGKTDLWPLFVRVISFFFVRSSLNDFPFAFASTMRELEALMALDDTKLKASLESYQHMDFVRTGPYRAVQLVSILIFVIHSLTESPELKEPKQEKDMEHSVLTELAFMATFICMGRLIERCEKGNLPDFSPLLPAVLVFVEWLVGMLDEFEAYGAGKKVTCAMSYFFGAFADLLNRIDKNEDEFESQVHAALWEDHELRGFAPVSPTLQSLDFVTHGDGMDNFDSMNACRVYRIIHAAMKFVGRSNESQKWIFYNKVGRKFYTADTVKFPYQIKTEAAAASSSCLELKEPNQQKFRTTKEHEEYTCGEEEEVILFKPITRYNSAPLSSLIDTNDQVSIGAEKQTAVSDECLSRARSLFTGHNQSKFDTSSFHTNTSNTRCDNPFKQQQQDPLLKDSATYPAGPPSLSAWVFNREIDNRETEKGKMSFSKHKLSPIEEVASESLATLSISGTTDTGSGHISAATSNDSSPYVAPLPSAPLLPDDAVWFRNNSSSFSECKSAVEIKEADGILGASPVSGHSNWSAAHRPFDSGPGVPGFIGGHPPLFGMSSSQWLHQYTKNHNIPGNITNFHGQDASRFEFFDRWGNPLVSNRMVYLESPELHPGSLIYGAKEQKWDTFFLGYQRQSPYGCGAGPKGEQPLLLQHLKEREWKLQCESQLRGSTFTGN